jgi:hypothetical protein
MSLTEALSQFIGQVRVEDMNISELQDYTEFMLEQMGKVRAIPLSPEQYLAKHPEILALHDGILSAIECLRKSCGNRKSYELIAKMAEALLPPK